MRFACALFIVIFLAAAPAQGQWLSDWPYRRPVTLSNPTSGELTDYQVKVLLDGSFDFSKTSPGGSDLRFTESDGTTLLNFWIEEWNPAGDVASIWVEMSSLPAGGDSIYMYYGDSAAASASDGGGTFDLYDGFEEYQPGGGGNPGEW
jgi:hypothetical protein